MKQDKITRTQDLKNLSTPEETVQVLRQSYANPMNEVLRRKAAAQKEGHRKNTQFWQAVEAMLSPAHKFRKSNFSVLENDY